MHQPRADYSLTAAHHFLTAAHVDRALTVLYMLEPKAEHPLAVCRPPAASTTLTQGDYRALDALGLTLRDEVLQKTAGVGVNLGTPCSRSTPPNGG